jgi:hypothetical protein
MATKLLDYTFNTSTYVFGMPLVLADVGQEVDEGVNGSDEGVEGNFTYNQ